MEISSLRRWCISVAVVNPIGTSFEAEVGSVSELLRVGFVRSFTFSKNLACLLLRYALYLLQQSPRGVGHRLDSVVTAIDDQLDISLCQASYALHFSPSKREVRFWARRLTNLES